MGAYILVVITYIFGQSFGMTVSQQEYSSRDTCLRAQQLILNTYKQMNEQNIKVARGGWRGASWQETISAECTEK
jgi:hypothetical protein